MGHFNNGSLRLCRVAGIDVFIHWTWLLVAVVEVQWRAERFSSLAWNVAEYLTLFGIVLLHEFGHALACRQVGGVANRIMLWPLGGIAYVSPPPRPGAVLWSIAAGPLVNVLLVPVTVGAALLAALAGWQAARPDLAHYLIATAVMNLLLLGFNLLPIYPLDGGQILQSLLWFAVGRARSLMAVSVIGLVVGAAVIVPALVSGFYWIGLIAAFVVLRCLTASGRRATWPGCWPPRATRTWPARPAAPPRRPGRTGAATTVAGRWIPSPRKAVRTAAHPPAPSPVPSASAVTRRPTGSPRRRPFRRRRGRRTRGGRSDPPAAARQDALTGRG
jgi:Zn-dependent protease